MTQTDSNTKSDKLDKYSYSILGTFFSVLFVAALYLSPMIYDGPMSIFSGVALATILFIPLGFTLIAFYGFIVSKANGRLYPRPRPHQKDKLSFIEQCSSNVISDISRVNRFDIASRISAVLFSFGGAFASLAIVVALLLNSPQYHEFLINGGSWLIVGTGFLVGYLSCEVMNHLGNKSGKLKAEPVMVA